MGFLELGHNYEFSHEVRREAQGASRLAPGKSGLYVCDEGEPINVLESWSGNRDSRRTCRESKS